MTRPKTLLLVSLVFCMPLAFGAAIPADVWDAAHAEKFEKALDTFFAEKDTTKRAEIFKKDIAPQDSELKLEELETIAKAAPPTGTQNGALWKVQYPWGKDNPRGWFNFAMPKSYSPTKASGLVIALHGSSGDGNNLPSFYTPQLNDAGYFIIYPTTTDATHMWNDPAEMATVYRLIEWAARNYRIDLRRLVVTGGSMGGMGTWTHLLEKPEIWSAGASIAGHPAAMQGDILEKLRGIPFYILHGEQDTNGVSMADVKNVRKAVEELKKRNLEHVYVEAPGAGHTPPAQFWSAMNEWIAKQPQKAFSPRPLFFPPAGKHTLWQAKLDPLGISSDPALALIREGKTKEARADLDARLKKDDARASLLRAICQIPALLDPLPDNLDPKILSDASKGWGTATETAALADIAQALRSKAGKDSPGPFDSYARLLNAKIWAKRFATSVGAGGTGWVPAYQACLKEIQAANQLDTSNAEVVRLAQAVSAKLPLKR